MSGDLERGILKANMYKFWLWNVFVKCNSCNNFVIWLFNLSPFAAKYCLVMWEESFWHLLTIRSRKQGKNSSLFKPIRMAAMPVWFSMVDRQSAKSFPNFGENQHFGFRKCSSRYSSHVPMTSSGFVEFYITDTDFWRVKEQYFLMSNRYFCKNYILYW